MNAAQRWHERRDLYRRPGEEIDTRKHGVEVVDERVARAYVERHHYSGSYPAARVAIGLFRSRAATRAELVGVCVFSVGMQPRAIPKWTGQAPAHGVELGRLVLAADVEWNGETWFLGRAFRELERELPDVRAVLSYSDPVERTTLHGEVFKPGHVGVIYQAHNGRHVGTSSPRTMYLDVTGREVSARSMSKIRNEERGAAGAYRQLLAAGAPARQPFEDPGEYVRRALNSGAFRRVRHPGNIAYAWPVGPQARKVRRELPPALPYRSKAAA